MNDYTFNLLCDDDDYVITIYYFRHSLLLLLLLYIYIKENSVVLWYFKMLEVSISMDKAVKLIEKNNVQYFRYKSR